jgi:hypothetical protein
VKGVAIQGAADQVRARSALEARLQQLQRAKDVARSAESAAVLSAMIDENLNTMTMLCGAKNRSDVPE